MSKFFDETMQGLLEAVAIDKGEIPLVEKEGMLAPTYVVFDKDEQLIDEFISLRKKENITQTELAMNIGNKQQTISKIENKKCVPSLKLFFCMLDSMGYDLKIVKKDESSPR